MKMFWLLLVTTILSIGAKAQDTLKDAFQKDFLMGVAINQSVWADENSTSAEIVKKQFNSISPENVLKWQAVQPQPGVFNFSAADRYVEFGVTNRMFVIGHNLIWHQQTPAWVFAGTSGEVVDRAALLARMRDHISRVVGRYRGKIGGWDVVNEALEANGELRDSSWRKIIGDDYLEQAYQFAHAADPQAQLYYNDFGLENEPKRRGALALIKRLQTNGAPIYGVGLQGHYSLKYPSVTELDATITAFAKLGVKVMITELDIDVLPPALPGQTAEVSANVAAAAELNPYTNGLPEEVQQKLTQRYVDIFSVFLKHRTEISRVTFWGVTDADSWLNYWPVHHRKSYPLLFDRNHEPKPAFTNIIRLARQRDGS